jgi:hypothetical protein
VAEIEDDDAFGRFVSFLLEACLLLHTFKVDVMPPVSDYLCGRYGDTLLGVETPLFLRGLVLSSRETRYVLACVEYVYLVGRSQQQSVETLAADVPVNAVG